MTGIGEMVKGWIFGRAAKKAAVAVATAAASYLAAHAGVADSWGLSVSIDPDQATLALIGALTIGRNFLKTKFPRVFGWC